MAGFKKFLPNSCYSRMIHQLRAMLLALVYVAISSGCNGQSNKPATVKAKIDTIVKGNFNSASGLVFDSVAIDSFFKKKPDFAQFAPDFKKLYGIHHFSYVWYDKNGITEATSNLINHLQTKQSDGVLKTFPYKADFDKMVNELQSEPQQKTNIEFELLLTAQYFNYAKNVWGGAAASKAADMGWYLPKKQLSYADLLQKQLSAPMDSVEHLAVVPQYIALKKALNKYQETEQAGPDITINAENKLYSIKPGDTSMVLVTLRKRLAQLGDLKQPSTSNSYDEDLQQAVINFKTRHGITPDAKLTAAFFKQLAIPVHQRIEQMIINLERMRWIPVDDHGGEFILVNIPEYQLHYFIDNKPVWDCRVVVGKVMNKTVIFSGHLQYIVFSPYWYIPPSIIQKEIKPGMARNSSYLSNHNMEWNGGNVRQRPGVNNSLGLVKFIFPNSHNIYLHDTPSKPLFDEDNRAFSHGCIRVAQPRALAIQILKQMPEWTPDRIDKAMRGNVEKTVLLKKKIPVYIGYFTAFVNSKGELNFREDIYDRDKRLLNFLIKS
jgi:murein L,D-transpeptidase YcbB/YkuD